MDNVFDLRNHPKFIENQAQPRVGSSPIDESIESGSAKTVAIDFAAGRPVKPENNVEIDMAVRMGEAFEEPCTLASLGAGVRKVLFLMLNGRAA